MAKQIEPDKNILLAEYSEAGAAMRAHADTRWKLLGVVIPISSGILVLSVQFPGLRVLEGSPNGNADNGSSQAEGPPSRTKAPASGEIFNPPAGLGMPGGTASEAPLNL